MEFFCYHRDRVGSTPLRHELAERHWSYMDRFADAMIARGPTYLPDETLTGSVHVLDLPDPAAARAFAFEEPGYQAGAYRDVLLRRWTNLLGTTMWDFTPSTDPAVQTFLVLGFHLEPATAVPRAPQVEGLIACGPLLSDDATWSVGLALLLEAPDADVARQALPAGRYVGAEVHLWDFGGR